MDECQPIRQSYECAIEDTEDARRRLTHWITTQDVDQDRTVIVTPGIDLSAYNMNRIVLWQHDIEQPAIGVNLWIKRSTRRRGLVARTQFADTAMGRDLYELYKSGVLRAWSIGADARKSDIIPHPVKNPTDPRFTVKACVLKEYSACNEAVNTGVYDDVPEEFAKCRQRLETETAREIITRCYRPKPQAEAQAPAEPPAGPTLPPLDGAYVLPALKGTTRDEAKLAVLRAVRGKDARAVVAALTSEAIDRLKGRP